MNYNNGGIGQIQHIPVRQEIIMPQLETKREQLFGEIGKLRGNAIYAEMPLDITKMYGTNIYSQSKAVAYEISYLKERTIDAKLEVKEHFDIRTLEGKVTDNKIIGNLLEN